MTDRTVELLFTRSEVELMVLGLYMRICYIETGNPTLRAADLKNADLTNVDAEVRVLSTDQMRLIVKMEDLIARMER